jgi:hypothetical protein
MSVVAREPVTPLREQYIFSACSYGVSVVRPPSRCPLCGNGAWLLGRRKPGRDT